MDILKYTYRLQCKMYNMIGYSTLQHKMHNAVYNKFVYVKYREQGQFNIIDMGHNFGL